MKKEPWRWIVFSLAVAYIAYMWISKGVGDAWTSMPADQLLPMAATSMAVTAMKVIAITTTHRAEQLIGSKPDRIIEDFTHISAEEI